MCFKSNVGVYLGKDTPAGRHVRHHLVTADLAPEHPARLGDLHRTRSSGRLEAEEAASVEFLGLGNSSRLPRELTSLDGQLGADETGRQLRARMLRWGWESLSPRPSRWRASRPVDRRPHLGGRMALSGYVLQNVLCVVVSYGFGLGLAPGSPGRTTRGGWWDCAPRCAGC